MITSGLTIITLFRVRRALRIRRVRTLLIASAPATPITVEMAAASNATTSVSRTIAIIRLSCSTVAYHSHVNPSKARILPALLNE